MPSPQAGRHFLIYGNFLRIGCGTKRKDRSTEGLNTPEWHVIRLDIDDSVDSDVIGALTDMLAVTSGSLDAVYSNHNIEHLYPHEVPLAMAESLRVFKPDGSLSSLAQTLGRCVH
jgi:predicted SAM-dependent methyltransferase